MRRRGIGPWRRLVYLATLLALVLSLVPIPQLRPGVARAASSPDTPPQTIHTAALAPLPQLPGLALSVAVAPDTLAVGMEATVTVTVSNEGTNPGEGIVVTAAPPVGTLPLPGPGYVSAQGGWRWEVGHLDPDGSAAVHGTLRVVAPGPGDALLLDAALTATGLPRPLGAEGGAILDSELATLTAPDAPVALPSAAPALAAIPAAVPVATATRRATAGAAIPAQSVAPTVAAPAASPAPDQGPRTTRHAPGQETTLTSADGKIAVTLPAGATDRPVTVREGRRPGPGAGGPTGVSQAGRKRGFGAFALSATDDVGVPVKEFPTR